MEVHLEEKEAEKDGGRHGIRVTAGQGRAGRRMRIWHRTQEQDLRKGRQGPAPCWVSVGLPSPGPGLRPCFPHALSCCSQPYAAAGPALVASTALARRASATTVEKVWKDVDLLLTGSGNHTAQLGHTWVTGRERESMGPAFCFYWGGGWGPGASETHSILVTLEREREI